MSSGSAPRAGSPLTSTRNQNGTLATVSRENSHASSYGAAPTVCRSRTSPLMPLLSKRTAITTLVACPPIVGPASFSVVTASSRALSSCSSR